MTEEETGQASSEVEVENTEVELPEVSESQVDAPEGEAAPEEAAAYEPDFSFKVYDETKEFDDWAKAIVKDKETEQQMREVMEKVHGLDRIKADREQLREKVVGYEDTANKYTSISKNLDVLSQHLNESNYDAFFKQLKIPEQAVMNWAAQRLQYHEMSPEQRAQYDQSVQAREQTVHLGQQNQEMQTQLQQIQHQQRMFELDNRIAQPGISEAAQAYDARVGQPGAFKQAVQERGLYHFKVNGVDVPVEQAVTEVAQMIGQPAQVGQEGQHSQPGVPPQAAAPPQAVAKKPVIPQVEGTGMSATRTAVKSLADIRKLNAARSGI